MEATARAGDGEKRGSPMPKLTPDQVNYLNIGLMLVAARLAFWLPFQLFVYAVLGPAHYLTEISWLREGSPAATTAPGRPPARMRQVQRRSR